MRKTLIFLCTLLLVITTHIAKAQDSENVQLKIGDLLELAPIDSNNYSFIDVYIKTRFTLNPLSYDSLTGRGLYDYFFTKGDFDAKRLPAKHAGKMIRIDGFQNVEGENGKNRTIILAWLEKDVSMIWIEMEAFNQGELILLR